MTLEDLYDEFEARLRRYAVSLVRDADHSEDLVQETFIRVMGHLDLLDQLNGHQRRAWLFRTLRNLFLDEVRSRQRREALAEQLEQASLLSGGFWTDEVSLDLFEAVPEGDRELLRQRYELGMNSREIADEIGVPPATVRSRLHLAVKRLRRRKWQFL
jgi:RNA polymerase sigma-70 factor (ECF subfamily)